MHVCYPPPVTYSYTGSCAGTLWYDPWLFLWALFTLLLVLGTALAVLSATRRLSRIERRLARHPRVTSDDQHV